MAKTWSKAEEWPARSGDLGRIGLARCAVAARTRCTRSSRRRRTRAASTVRPTSGGAGRSVDDYVSRSPQYYQELFVDPVDPDRVYSMDVWMQVTERRWRELGTSVGESSKHVDNHALWIDPADTRHLIAGCDGGVYESFDRGAELAVQRPTCRSRSSTGSPRQRLPVLQRLRRHAGQLQPRRPGADDQRQRHHQPRVVHDARWATASRRSSIRRMPTWSTRSISTAGWCATTGRSGEAIDIKPRAADWR